MKKQVTGGTDFRAHLCERLLNEECKVFRVGNYFTRRTVGSLLSAPTFEAMRHDVTFPASPIYDQHDVMPTTKTSLISAFSMPRLPYISREQQLLHWSPNVGIQEGLSRTISYFDILLSSPSAANKLVWKAVR